MKSFYVQSTEHLLKDFLTPVSFGIKKLESEAKTDCWEEYMQDDLYM